MLRVEAPLPGFSPDFRLGLIWRRRSVGRRKSCSNTHTHLSERGHEQYTALSCGSRLIKFGMLLRRLLSRQQRVWQHFERPTWKRPTPVLATYHNMTTTCHPSPTYTKRCVRGTMFSTMRVRVANSAANWWKSVELKERQERVRRGQSNVANARLRKRRGRKAVVNRLCSGALLYIAHVACNVVYQSRQEDCAQASPRERREICFASVQGRQTQCIVFSS